MNRSERPPTVGYVVSTWPRLSQTFVLREILALERLGVPVRIFSTKDPDGEPIHGDVAQVRAGVTYLTLRRHWKQVDRPADLAKLKIAKADHGFFLAQRYVENAGFDIKLYVAGTEVYADAKKSPLHPDVDVKQRLLPLTPALRELALRTGKIFGLDMYGLDVLETSHGPVVVDINDFPSFSNVQGATTLLTGYVLQLASRTALGWAARPGRTRGRRKPLTAAVLHRLITARAVR
jgi:Inositol 1,3,4-trisphosphate 5/6-kinase ATP-grasp domain